MIRTAAIGTLLWLTACSEVQGEGDNGTAPTARQEAGLEPGEWEVATELVNPGGGPEGVEAATYGKGREEDIAKAIVAGMRNVQRTCLTPQKAAELFAGDPGQGCKREGEGWRKGRIATKVSCTEVDPAGTSVHEVSGRYSARSFEVTQRLTETFDGETTTTITRDTGRRVGDCPAAK